MNPEGMKGGVKGVYWELGDRSEKSIGIRVKGLMNVLRKGGEVS